MPHEVADLEPVLLMLSKQDLTDLKVIQLVCIRAIRGNFVHKMLMFLWCVIGDVLACNSNELPMGSDLSAILSRSV